MTLTQGRAFVNTVVNRDGMLIDRAVQGDRTALDELVRRHQERAYNFAYRLTRDRDEAADLVAEAFVRVSRSIKGFHGQSAFTTWLYRILSNCYLDARKRANRHHAASLDEVMQNMGESASWETDDEREDMVDYVDRGMKAQVLAAAIDRLPKDYRTIIVMYHCENLGYEEIAEVLEIPLGTVKSRLNRARIALRDRLAGKADILLAETA